MNVMYLLLIVDMVVVEILGFSFDHVSSKNFWCIKTEL